MIVTKFGGSSVADSTQFKKIKAIIEANPARRVVVVSAPGKRYSSDTKVTDYLYTLGSHLKYGVPDDRLWNAVVERYKEIKESLNLTIDIEAELAAFSGTFGKDIDQNCLVSRGEYFCARLMSDYLGFTFVDAADIMCFSYDGTLDIAESEKRVIAAFEKYGSIVVPGFYGAYPNGDINLFSRGGSDITGSIVARAAQADIYENWTDVSGFLMADPRIIENPQVIDTITYRELRELSYMGAGVLHEEAIFPVRKEGIPINIKNTNAPEDPGTLIVESTSRKTPYTITGIAGKKGFCSIIIDKALMNTEVGFGRKVLEVLEKYNIPFEHMPSGIDTMSVLVHQDEFEENEQAVLAGIHRAVHPDYLDIESDLALIAVVGRGMKSNRGTAARIFAALSHEKINIRMIDQGSSELNIIIGVHDSDFELAIRSIYDVFVTTAL